MEPGHNAEIRPLNMIKEKRSEALFIITEKKNFVSVPSVQSMDVKITFVSTL